MQSLECLYLDVTTRVKPLELVEPLMHEALDLALSARVGVVERFVPLASISSMNTMIKAVCTHASCVNSPTDRYVVQSQAFITTWANLAHNARF